MTIELKIKAKSLGAESQMIRKEELKLKRSARWNDEHQQAADAVKFRAKRRSLYEHRVQDVRFESRATHLARAYISGHAYSDIERNPRQMSAHDKAKLLGRTEKLISKYHKKITPQTMEAWFNA